MYFHQIILGLVISFIASIPLSVCFIPWYLDLHLEIDSEGRLRTKLYDKRYDFNFPIVNFPFICSIFQSLWFLSGFPRLRVAANKEATEPGVPLSYVEVITWKVLRSPPWLGWPLWNTCVTNEHGYVPIVVSTSRFFPHSWLITALVTR